MDEQVDKKVKDRSPNFPFISLTQAVDRAQAFYEQERKGAAPVGRAALHWKYSPSSSGLLQTIAALKSYGLMSDESAEGGRRLRLTDLGLRIVLDTRTESAERKELLRRAALMPNVCKLVNANWEGSLPSVETLNHYLVLELGFAPVTAARAVKILQLNQQYTSGSSGSTLSASDLNDEDSESSDVSDVHVVDGDTSDSSTAVHGNNWVSGSARQTWLKVMKRPVVAMTGVHTVKPVAQAEFIEQVMDEEGRPIRIEFGVAPTVEVYEFLKDYFDLRIKALERRKSVQLAAQQPAQQSVVTSGAAKSDSDSDNESEL